MNDLLHLTSSKRVAEEYSIYLLTKILSRMDSACFFKNQDTPYCADSIVSSTRHKDN